MKNEFHLIVCDKNSMEIYLAYMCKLEQHAHQELTLKN